jgi:hypothetical protein
VREIIIFAVLNGIGPLIQDATVAFNTAVPACSASGTASWPG